MNGQEREVSVFTLAGETPLESGETWPMREDLFSTGSEGDTWGEVGFGPDGSGESGFETPAGSGFGSGFETGPESGGESAYEWQESGLESPDESGPESAYESGFEGYESDAFASAVESDAESPYGSGFESGFESGDESPEESPPESALQQQLGGSFEDSALEASPFATAQEYQEGSSFEAFPGAQEDPLEAFTAEDAWPREYVGEYVGEDAGEYVGESGEPTESEAEAAFAESHHEAPKPTRVPRHVIDFVAAYGAQARASEAATAVPALVILGQAALESGWGKKAPGFNFFGIKARASDPAATRQLITTREVLSRPDATFPQVISVTKRPDGKYAYLVKDWFRTYPSASDGFAAHGQFLRQNKRYAKAFRYTADPYAFARAVAAAGYATDPSYAAVLTSVMRLIERAGGTAAPAPAAPRPASVPSVPGPAPAPAPSSGGVPVPVPSVPIPALPAPASPCLTGSDAPLDRALRTPDPGTARYEGIVRIADFAAALARVHAQRLGGDPARREAELAADYASTMKAAMSRYGSAWRSTMQRRVARRRQELQRARRGPLTAQDRVALEAVRCGQETWWLSQLNTIRRGWMVGRREQLDFRTLMPKVKPLGTFLPPPLPPGGTPALTPIAPLGTGTPITAETKKFLAELRRIAGPSFEASNYTGHGGAGFTNRGYSLDLFLQGPLDDRGFYQRDKAVVLMGQIAAAARAVGLRWRVLYNDFAVAAEVNRRTGTRHVVFVGESRKGLNWHGPLILHFHLDLAP